MEAFGILGLLLAAGGESTTSLLGTAVRILAERPELQDRLRSDPELIPTFVEEACRLDPPFRGHYRQVAIDTTLGGVDIPARSRLVLLWPAANRDESLCAKPDQFGSWTDQSSAPPRLRLGHPFVCWCSTGATRSEGCPGRTPRPNISVLHRGGRTATPPQKPHGSSTRDVAFGDRMVETARSSTPQRLGATCAPCGCDPPYSHDGGDGTVGEYKVAGVELPYAEQSERDAVLQILKKGSPLAEHDREDHDSKFVEDTGLRKVGGQMRAPEQRAVPCPEQPLASVRAQLPRRA